MSILNTDVKVALREIGEARPGEKPFVNASQSGNRNRRRLIDRPLRLTEHITIDAGTEILFYRDPGKGHETYCVIYAGGQDLQVTVYQDWRFVVRRLSLHR